MCSQTGSTIYCPMIAEHWPEVQCLDKFAHWLLTLAQAAEKVFV